MTKVNGDHHQDNERGTRDADDASSIPGKFFLFLSTDYYLQLDYTTMNVHHGP